MHVWEALLFTRAMSVQNMTGRNEPITWPLVFLLGAFLKPINIKIKTQMSVRVVTYNVFS